MHRRVGEHSLNPVLRERSPRVCYQMEGVNLQAGVLVLLGASVWEM